jgi:hypothetical protein
MCYPPTTDWSCKFSAEELIDLRSDPDKSPKLVRAESFAWSLLAALTAYRIGVCPVTVRPCAAGCEPSGGFPVALAGGGLFRGMPSMTIGSFHPYISGGIWYNACGCRRGDCSCAALSEVFLPGPVGGIESVIVDGVVLPRGSYRVDNGYRLVRLDGEKWPVCQDMTATNEDGFSVTYYRGARPNIMTNAAAGALAAEFYEACQGNACRLPGNVTSVTTQGSSYEFEPTDYPEGKTGIPEVDAVIRIYNPYGLKSAPTVVSPDAPTTRVPTWT